MYAHHIIDSLKNELKNSVLRNNNEFIRETHALINDMINSQKFHMDTVDSFVEFCKKNNGSTLWEFTDVKLPYQTCYFDWDKDSDGPIKYGCLAIEDKEDENIIHAVIFFFLKEHYSWERGYNFYKIEASYNCHSAEVKISTRKTTSGSLLYKINTEFEKIIVEEEVSVLSSLNFGLMLLSCKNIGTKKVDPPEALNRKRKKHGKTELYTYKTLIIKPIGKKQESIPKNLWNNRIHLCRGHFKTYTEEKPLFGNITGRFWWQPIVRGKNKKGVVMKDYKVKEK